MFTQEAINQALSIWLSAAAIGLVFALLIALMSTRGGHAEHDHAPDSHAENHADHHDSPEDEVPPT